MFRQRARIGRRRSGMEARLVLLQSPTRLRPCRLAAALFFAAVGAGCGGSAGTSAAESTLARPSLELDEPQRDTGGSPAPSPRQLGVLDRVTWGASGSSARAIAAMGTRGFLEQQLNPSGAMPPAVQHQIDALSISQRTLDELVFDLEKQRKDADAIADPDQKKAAQQAYQQELNRLGREAATRTLLRALYAPDQLKEQMTWFWMNHFNVHQYKANIRVLVGDYEERAIRPNALGRFRTLLAATAHHPAMLRYLDNEQNAAGHLNENYARELMELHTLGVGGGYSQKDVQELARVLTGVGVNMTPNQPNVKADLKSQYVRDGLFEFNPNRHDYGAKVLLGEPIGSRGLAELDEALDRLARQAATARFISRKLATFFVSDDPPPALIEAMAATFRQTDGDIAATLRTMFSAPEFARSLETKFKDPIHYVVSAVRLAYDDKPILNTGPMLGWLNRMGEPLFAHETPDGYPLTQAAWASAGQMTVRFEIAKSIGAGSAGLFKTDGPQPLERPAFPQLANALYFRVMERRLSDTTREALDRSVSQQDWNLFLLASPELMYR
jgi:uncharacterized protein (DUF1800 family)